MKSKFLALAIATAALKVFAPAVGHAQGFQVNGHAASKAEAQLLVSYGVQKGNWVVDGFGIASADSGHIASDCHQRRAEVLVCSGRAALRVRGDRRFLR